MFGRRGTLRRPEFRRQGHGQPWSVGVRTSVTRDEQAQGRRKTSTPSCTILHVPVRSLCVRPYDKRTELGPNSSQSARRDPLRGRIARPAGRIACIAGSPMDVRSEYTNGNTEGHRSSVECRCSARQGGSAFVIEQASHNTLLYIVCKSQYGFATVKNVNSTPYTYFSHGMLLLLLLSPLCDRGGLAPR